MNKPPFPILFEDNHLLVIDKPVGIATQGTTDGMSVYDQSRAYIKQKYNKPGNVYLGIVSRLDTVTSGVLVLARTSKAASRLSDMQRRGVIQKQYLAVVEGRLPAEESTCEVYVCKDDAAHRMVVCSQTNADAKLARLSYQVLQSGDKGALVRVQLLTGRKHQIRLQFSHLGCPVVGDRKYGATTEFGKGIALHAASLSLAHPVGNAPLQFEARLPARWQRMPPGVDVRIRADR